MRVPTFQPKDPVSMAETVPSGQALSAPFEARGQGIEQERQANMMLGQGIAQLGKAGSQLMQEMENARIETQIRRGEAIAKQGLENWMTQEKLTPMREGGMAFDDGLGGEFGRFEEGGPSFQDSFQRFRETGQQIKEVAKEGVEDPSVRQMIDQRVDQMMMERQDDLAELNRERQLDWMEGATEETLDRFRAVRDWEGAEDTIGTALAQGVWSPEEAVEARRSLMVEKNVTEFQDLVVEEGVEAGRERLQQFREGPGMEMPQQQREAIVKQMNTVLNRESARDQAERTELTNRVDSAISVLESGYVPVGLEETFQAAQQAGMSEELSGKIQVAQAGLEFANLRPDEQRSRLDELEGRMRSNRVTEQDVELRDFLESIHNNQISTLEQDGLSLPIQQGIIDEPGQLQFGDMDAFVQGLADRKQASQQAEAYYQRNVGPLRGVEADMIADRFQQADVNQQIQLLGAMQDGLGEKMPQALQQMDMAGYRQMAFVGGIAQEGTEDAIRIARRVLLGRRQRDAQEGTPDIMPDPSMWNMEIRDQLGGAFAGPASTTRRQAEEAIKSYYAQSAAEAGDFSGELDVDRLEEAVQAVTGGIIEWDSGDQRSTIIPPERGMTEPEFNRWMGELQPAHIEAMGGVSNLDNEMALNTIRDRGRLVQIGQSEYLIATNSPSDGQDRFLHSPDGEPFVLQWRPMRELNEMAEIPPGEERIHTPTPEETGIPLLRSL